MGEFEFIEKVRRAFEGIGDEAIVGIGDDCAVMPASVDESIVMTTDMLTEGIHFLRRATSARELGAKALAVNLSDVAAMGARPVASLLSLALPEGLRGEWAEEFMAGYREISARWNVKLAGGDTTASAAGVTIGVTAIGRARTENLKYRSGARVGDIIAVNAPLGESAAGLREIWEWIEARYGDRNPLPAEPWSIAGHWPDSPLAHVHRNPTPQVAEGMWLGGRAEVHAMIDLSDGLASDLRHIIACSGVGARVDLGAIPTPVALELALAGGEDYKLLLTAAPEGWERLAADYLALFGTALHPIGTITEPSKAGIVWTEGGKPVTRNLHGYTHF